jgi:hypothetical protein
MQPRRLSKQAQPLLTTTFNTAIKPMSVNTCAPTCSPAAFHRCYRPFMKAQHLLNLPAAPAAKQIQQQTSWKPSSTAWLSCTWQNWCCYSAQHSQKNTVVFTNLPKGALQEKRCSQDCLVAANEPAAAAAASSAADTAAAGGSSKPGRKPGKHKHPVNVRNNPGGSVANAAWPLAFVESAIKACVDVVRQKHRGAAGAAATA